MEAGAVVLLVVVAAFVLLVALAIRRMARSRAERAERAELPEEAAPPGEAVPEPEPVPQPAPAPAARAPEPAPPALPPAPPALPPAPPPARPAPSPAPRPAVAPVPAPPEAPRRPVAEPSPIAPRPLPEPLPKPAPPPREERRAQEAKILRVGLARTRGGFIARLAGLLRGKQLPADLVERLEEVLLTADIGVRTSNKLLGAVRAGLGRAELAEPQAVLAFLRGEAAGLLRTGADAFDPARARPFVLLVVGVNGTGKTTTIGKLAARLRGEGRSVLLAAGDTFRAAAAEQLEIWARRCGAELVRGKEGSDPSAVVFDAVKRAQRDGFDVVIADTAGRLHTKVNLMEELQKVRRVVAKAQEGAPHETLLVLDATTGQNAIAQAQMFKQAIEVSGLVLTKLDGTAKGGVILGVCDELGLPVRFIGVGERVEDLRPFDPDAFVDALFEEAESVAAPPPAAS